MKKIFKMLLTTCLLLLAVCGASLSVSARTYYYKGLISIDPSFPDSVFDANEEIQIPLTVISAIISPIFYPNIIVMFTGRTEEESPTIIIIFPI